MKTVCPDCGAKPSSIHMVGCDVERCTVCKGQRLQCDLSECEGHDPIVARWVGEWPGKAECREKGWYSHRNPHGNGWVPCSPDHPDATEDLNRLSVWEQTGKDSLYPTTVLGYCDAIEFTMGRGFQPEASDVKALVALAREQYDKLKGMS